MFGQVIEVDTKKDARHVQAIPSTVAAEQGSADALIGITNLSQQNVKMSAVLGQVEGFKPTKCIVDNVEALEQFLVVTQFRISPRAPASIEVRYECGTGDTRKGDVVTADGNGPVRITGV